MKAEGMPENRAKCREETFDVEPPWMERIWAGRAQGEYQQHMWKESEFKRAPRLRKAVSKMRRPSRAERRAKGAGQPPVSSEYAHVSRKAEGDCKACGIESEEFTLAAPDGGVFMEFEYNKLTQQPAAPVSKPATRLEHTQERR